jgi:hypothetical protein
MIVSEEYPFLIAYPNVIPVSAKSTQSPRAVNQSIKRSRANPVTIEDNKPHLGPCLKTAIADGSGHKNMAIVPRIGA